MKEGSGSPEHNENVTISAFTDVDLKELLLEIPCIGEISREGKDAAGKPLENEFYYVPDMDTDEMRKNAVEGGLGKTSLRAVRKQHKVLSMDYFLAFFLLTSPAAILLEKTQILSNKY